jgi:hypothetical protein
MSHLIWITLAVCSGVAVEARPLAGPAVRGELVEISPDVVLVQSDDGLQRVDRSELWEITATSEAPPLERIATAWVSLIDGSQVHASHFTVEAGVAGIHLTTGESLSVRTRLIRAVRFRDYSTDPRLAAQWREIADAKTAGDTIVIRRSDNLDQLEGVIRDISDAVVQFEFDGDRIDVNRSKLDGILFYHPLADQLPDRTAQIADVSGSLWNVKTLRTSEGQLEAVTVAGVKLTFRPDHLRKIDFSSGNTVWLDDLEPESFDWYPFVASRLPQEQLARLFDPRSSHGPLGRPLLLGGQAYTRGLATKSRTELVYRLTEDYRHFHALVGIDDRVREGGNVRLLISGDDKELFARTITGRDEPFPVDLDISGVRRLKILVDFGEELDIADHLNLCEARITK